MDEQLKREIILTLVSSLLFVGIWYLTEMPEWKRQALLARLRGTVQVKTEDGLSIMDLLTLAKFRTEVSNYDGSRDDKMAARPTHEGGN